MKRFMLIACGLLIAAACSENAPVSTDDNVSLVPGVQPDIVANPAETMDCVFEGSDNPDLIKWNRQGKDGWRITGTPGTDFIDCRIEGSDVTIVGGDGDDFLWGGSGDDQLVGGNGADELCGNDGKDHMIGGTGDDFLLGEAELDRFNGGTGYDRCDDVAEENAKGCEGDINANC